jgi:flavin-dependent dehydrogenase
MLVGGVRFAPGAANSASWIDSFPGGWLFWFPVEPSAGIIQVMLPDLTEFPRECIQEALAASSFASQSLCLDDSEVKVYRAAPGFRTHLREAGAVAVGSGAARLDPLCGDGTGFSLRTALLAAAVADHCRHAPTAEAPWRHYCSRVAAATAHHLRACDRFYSMAESGDTWSRELELGRQGLAMLETLHPPHSSAYRLVGRRLAHYPVLANDSPGGRP